MTKSSFSLEAFIGLIQVIGGLMLTYTMLDRFIQVGMLNPFTVILPFTLFTFLCFYSGISLFTNRKRGINLSIFNFSLQLFQFSFAGLYYFFIIGPYVTIGYQKPFNSSIEFWTNYKLFTGTLMLYTREETSSHFLAINLVTVIILSVLIYLKMEKYGGKVKNTIANNI